MEKVKIKVEVAYASTDPDKQYIIALEVEEGATVEQAIKLSGLLKKCTEIQLDVLNKVGIFGTLCHCQEILKNGDRVEVYRPLFIDPMQKRFQKVKKERTKK